jgi:hypothetical protein
LDVVKDIGASLPEMVRSEIRLARMEIAGRARQARSSAVMLVSAGILGIHAIGFVCIPRRAVRAVKSFCRPGWPR